MVKSKKGFLKYYLPNIFFIFLYLFGSYLLITKSLKYRNQIDYNGNPTLLLIFAIFLFAMAIYTIYAVYKNSPNIKINNKQIQFNNKTIEKNEIKEIILQGKMPFIYIFKHPMEGTAIILKNGIIKFFFDDVYSNTSELKTFLEQVYIQNKKYKEIKLQHVEKRSLEFENITYYKKFIFTSLRGITFFILFVPIVFGIFNNIIKLNVEPLIWAIPFLILWIIFNAWQTNYFGISQKYFVIKNHILFSRIKIFDLRDVKEIVIETRYKLPYCLRVNTVNYETFLYPASTLDNKTWSELIKELKIKNIKIRNEIGL